MGDYCTPDRGITEIMPPRDALCRQRAAVDRRPNPQVQAFFDAFARLRQTVIMRLKSTPLEGIAVPPNVLVESVVPQQAILAHGRTVAFFTQGGANSVMESIYHR